MAKPEVIVQDPGSGEIFNGVPDWVYEGENFKYIFCPFLPNTEQVLSMFFSFQNQIPFLGIDMCPTYSQTCIENLSTNFNITGN